MKAMKLKEVEALLSTKGFQFERTGRHDIWKHIITGLTLPLPNGKEISPGTMRDVMKRIKVIQLAQQSK